LLLNIFPPVAFFLSFFLVRDRGRFGGGILDCRCHRVNPNRFRKPEPAV